MRSFVQKLRGLLGLGAFSAAAWASIGVVLGTIVLLVDPASVDAGEGPLWIAYYFGRAGFVAGVGAGMVLALIERRRALASLRILRVAVWGAAGGFALPWLAVAPRPMLPLFIVLGAGTSTLALLLARRGERLVGESAGERLENSVDGGLTGSHVATPRMFGCRPDEATP